jgi:sugar phosphate isomerase/epimerase
MQRRTFLVRVGSLSLSLAAGPGFATTFKSAHERVGLGTVTFRTRFEQTRPKDGANSRPLALLQVPEYYRDRFKISSLEFWSRHFESLDETYLKELRRRIDAVGAQLVNVQVDADYDLASTDETLRQRSLETVRRWIDAAALLGSRAVRVNPGQPNGSVERSIASLEEVNRYCQSRDLPLLTENHFGIEMDPDVHLRIREGAGPDNVYTLPDFGNYPVESMMASLAKILPHAYAVSAKTVDFDAQGRHVSYDFERCLELCEKAGFSGVYLVEQWSRKEQPVDAEKIADWMLERTRSFLNRLP